MSEQLEKSSAELPFPAMPLYVRDWLAGRAVRLMTLEQRGAFMQLLCDAWGDPVAPCSLPNNDTDLADLSGFGEEWSNKGRRVRAQFLLPDGMAQLGYEVPDDGRLRNPKQWQVYQLMLERRHKNSESGKRGMAKRWTGWYPHEFECQWALYPKRIGGNPKKPAFLAWQARVNDGASLEELGAAVERYAAYIRAIGKEGTEFVLMAQTFFGPNERWKEDFTPPAAGSQTANLEAARKWWKAYCDEYPTDNSSGNFEYLARRLEVSVEVIKEQLGKVRPWDIRRTARDTEAAVREVARRLA